MALRRHERGQVTVEMAVLFGFAVAGMVAMSIYLQRAVQGGMKSNADSLGSQFSIQDGWKSFSRSGTRDEKTETRSGQYTTTCQKVSKGGNAQAPDCSPDDGVQKARVNPAIDLAYPALVKGKGGRTRDFEMPIEKQD